MSSHRISSTSSLRTKMILTLLCQVLLLESWTTGHPSSNPSAPDPKTSLSPTTPGFHIQNQNHLQLSQPSIASLKQSQNQNTIVTSLNDLSNEPSPSTSDSNSNSNKKENILLSRQRRQNPLRDRLFPTFNPPFSYNGRSRALTSSSSSNSNSNSNGLAYRSIIPSLSGSNHYTNIYRNRNLYNNNNNNNRRSHTDSPHETVKNTINSQDLPLTTSINDNGETSRTFLQDNLDVYPNPSPTAQSSRSAPATDPISSGSESRVSSTIQMQVPSQEEGDLGSRDGIGYKGNNKQITKPRESKARKGVIEHETMIIFPGFSGSPSTSGSIMPSHNSSSRHLHLGQNKRDEGTKAHSSRAKFGINDDYEPPFKTLSASELEGLRRLLETSRKKPVPMAKEKNVDNGAGNHGRERAFPAGTSNTNSRSSLPNLEITNPPECASETGYCEDVDSYPKEFFNNVLHKSLTPTVFQDVFGDSVDNNSVATDVLSRNDLTSMSENPLCTAIEHTIYPQVAQNRNGKFLYIVNHEEYIQGVRVEKCVRENQSCDFGEGSNTLSNSHIQSNCRQKYIYKKLFAVSPEGKGMTDTFRLPSCCVCYISNSLVANRINPANLAVASDTEESDPEKIASDSINTKLSILPKKSASSTIAISSNLNSNSNSNDTLKSQTTHEDVGIPVSTTIPSDTSASGGGEGTSSELVPPLLDEASIDSANNTKVDSLFEFGVTSGPFFRDF